MEFGLVAIWLGACVALAVAGWPIAATCFRTLPDRGAAFSLPVSLAVLALVVFWIGHRSVTLGLVAGLLCLLGGSAFALVSKQSRKKGKRSRPPIAAFEAGVVFVLAFGLVLSIRAFDPAVHPGGGEKFLDFGLLKSLLRADTLPPEDVWFAGEGVQYYYGGHLIASVLARLTGIEGRFAYNLALATFYGMLVTTVYSLAGAIAARHNAPRRLAGGFGAFLVGIASNLVTPFYALLVFLPESIAGAIAGVVSGRSALSVDSLLVSPARYSYWTASRVIEGTVNEFPLFAWLNGDLHAHMMSTPFLVCVVGLGYAYLETPATNRRRRQGLVFGVLPPLVGLLAVINVWSFPTAIGLTWLWLALGSPHPATVLPTRVGDRLLVEGGRPKRELVRVGTGLLLAFCVLALAFAWSLPFWIESASPGGRGIGVGPDRSSLTALVMVHGAFLSLFVPYLADRSWPTLDDRFRVLVGAVVVLAVAVVHRTAALGLFGPLLVVSWLLLRGPDLLPNRTDDRNSAKAHTIASGNDRGASTDTDGGTVEQRTGETPGTVGYETLLVLAGVGLVLLVEFVFLEEQAGPGRYNTVFKTYMQVWVLFAIAGGVVGARLFAHNGVGRAIGVTRKRATVLLAVLVCVTSVYGVVSLGAHFEDPELDGSDGPTLDALAFVSATHPEEAAAIEWLDRTTGTDQPNMVSAPGTDVYGWVNGPSSLTGVPTVVGWSHEIGYRGEQAYDRRVEAVDRIFTGDPTTQVRLLRAYNVRYVYVGPVERERYGSELGVSELTGLRVAYRNNAVTIYAVDRTELGPR